MTTAIEQAKREMYDHLESVKLSVTGISTPTIYVRRFEEFLETYLEQLRQQYEEMASTAHQRFESIQSMERVNQDLIASLENFKSYNSRQADTIGRADDEIADLESKLAKMTESRDLLRNLHQAATHASIERAGQASTSGQTSGDRASCEQPDANAIVIIGALLDAQRVMVEYLVPDGIRAKDAIGKMIPILDNEKLYSAMHGFEHPDGVYAAWFINNDKCMHFFFTTVGGQMKCAFCGVGK